MRSSDAQGTRIIRGGGKQLPTKMVEPDLSVREKKLALRKSKVGAPRALLMLGKGFGFYGSGLPG